MTLKTVLCTAFVFLWLLCAPVSAQEVWAWGYNGEGQLGDSTTTQRTTPTQVGTDTDWAAVTAGGYHTLALKSDGTLWAWGYNGFGQLGDGTTNDQTTPTQVGTDTDWASATAGGYHSLARKSDGTLWAWGRNGEGQLGDGTTNDQTTPTQVGTDTDWAVLDAGLYHSLALKSDGTLWAWGYNAQGQLGDGTTTDRTTPTQIGTDTDWASATAGGYHSLARKSDGTLWAWGHNASGQLGDGTTNDQTTPTQVGTDTDWSVLVAGAYHSLALKSDGTLWAWGYNAFNQLGDGTTNDQTTPTQVGTDTDWSVLDAGAYHSLARKSDGTLWAWGYNYYGQLGDGTTTQRTTPTQVGTETDWVLASAGEVHSMGLRGASDNIAPTALCKNITITLGTNGLATITASDVDNGSSDDIGVASMTVDLTNFDCTHVGQNTVRLIVTDAAANADTCFSTVTVVDPTPVVITGNINPTQNTLNTYSIVPSGSDTYVWSEPTLGDIWGSNNGTTVEIKWLTPGTDTLEVQETHASSGCVTTASLEVTVGAVLCFENAPCISIQSIDVACQPTTGNMVSYSITLTFDHTLETANFIRIYDMGYQGGTFTFPYHNTTMTITGEKPSHFLSDGPLVLIIDVYDVLPNGKATKCSMQRCVQVNCP